MNSFFADGYIADEIKNMPGVFNYAKADIGGAI